MPAGIRLVAREVPSVAGLGADDLARRWLAAFSQAGLVEEFLDPLVGVVVPAFLSQLGPGLAGIGWIVGT